MRITRSLNTDLEVTTRFVSVLGSGMQELNSNKFAGPGFFVLAHSFVSEYIEGRFFKKEELLINVLQDIGFSPEASPISSLRDEQEKSHEAAEQFIEAAKQWQAGDEVARNNVSWAVSEYTSTMREHLQRIKTLVVPLLEQNLTVEEEHKIAEGFNTIVFEADMESDPDKYEKLIKALEDELSDWR